MRYFSRIFQDCPITLVCIPSNKELAATTSLVYADLRFMDPQEKMRQMLAQLWEQHRSEIQARVEIIAGACQAAGSGRLTESQRLEAHSAAHKLAGVLGTFGRNEGTNLARTLENHFAATQDSRLDLDELSRTLLALRNEIL